MDRRPHNLPEGSDKRHTPSHVQPPSSAGHAAFQRSGMPSGGAPSRPLNSQPASLHPSYASSALPPTQASSWSVPNPLLSGAPPQPQQLQPAPFNRAMASSTTTGAPTAQPPNRQQQKHRVLLTPEAKRALAKAIWSAIRSPDGSIAPAAMEQAMATGLPKNAVLNAARVAREREAIKRRQQQQQQQRAAAAAGITRPPNSNVLPQQMQQQQQQQRPPYKPSIPLPTKKQPPVRPLPPVSSTLARPMSKPTPKQPSAQQTKAAKARLEELSRWKRVHSGVFVVQKGRYAALANSVGSVLRCQTDALPCKRVSPQQQLLYSHASILQRQILLSKKQPTPTSTIQLLLDPDKHKRFKIQPKREAKALDRMMRKSRTSTAEVLLKQNKELSKNIVSHQFEFFKFHRLRRAEAHRLAKAARDFLGSKGKKKEKEEDMAERARLAALRANDMAAYSKLLEETKNDRLKFLLGKTDECISQISGLLQERSIEEKNTAEFASASAASTGSYYASAHLKMEEVRQPGILVGGELKEYQLGGLQWLVSLYNNKLNGILADEMGLGKTIQTIALIAYLMEFKENLGPYLVVVPLSTLSNWVNEFAKWCPSARVIIYKGTPSQRKELFKEQVRNGHFNVLLTTYEYIIKDKASLKKIHWKYAIVDEGHRMKNAESKFAVTLGTHYNTDNRILLTGTPLQNSLPELWALLNFLLPTIFSSVESFDQWFNKPFAQFGSSSGGDEDKDSMLSNEERMLIIHRLHELLRPFMLRRVKSEVLDQLPEKVEKVLRCELSSWQKELYKQISAKATQDKSLLGLGGQGPSRGLNNVVMQLRKVCNHPYLFSPEGYHINENLIWSSGKVELLDRMLPKLKAAGHRVLLFTQMTAVMTILEDYFAFRGYPSLRLDGSTPAEEREKRMYKFNAPDSPYFIFLLSTRAGGLGLNLATADTVIIFDSDWNPMMDLQAQDRAHRIGQRSDVSVFRLITYSPVEERILNRATEKLNMSELVVEAGKFDKSSVENDNSLERRQMMETLLTDFDTTTTQQLSSTEPLPSASEEEATSGDGSGADDSAASDSGDEDFNELLGSNENDYQLYTAMDGELAKNRSAFEKGLFSSPDTVPDWIKYPNGKDAASNNNINAVGDGSRKRKAVAYDDGLTEKQFIRLMEKQADEDEKRSRKRSRSPKPPTSMSVGKTPREEAESLKNATGGLTDWTFRKLISISKAVIALKDPSTKRRLSEVFLEKPCHSTYPDYYEMIEKPIAINDILRKCRGKLYANLEEFRVDWKLLFSNARKYNGEGSWVVVDAAALEKELERLMKKNGFEPKPPKKKPLRIKLSLKSLKGNAKKSSDGEPPTKKARKGSKKNGKKDKLEY